MEEIDMTLLEKLLQQLADKAWDLAFRVAMTLAVIFVGVQLIRLARKLLKRSLTRFQADMGVIQFLDSLVKVALYAILLMIVLTGFGVDAASIIAVLGSAGVAVGLALQGSLSNLAGGVLILLLKPFRVGDYIIEDNKKNEGVVTEIQIFYTKLMTGDNRIIVLPNGTLANSSLTNVTDTPYRRVELKVGIAYDSDLRRAKSVLLAMLEEDGKVLKDRPMQVYVEELGRGSVTLGIRCWFMREDLQEGKWRLTEAMKYRLEENGIVLLV